LNGDLSGGGPGTDISMTGTPTVSGGNTLDDVTEASIAIGTTTTTTANGAFILSGYTNTLNLITNPQIPNEAGNLSINRECRIVYVVGLKTYTAA
jgi:hypothetical protein